MKKKIRILSLCFVLLAAVTVFAVTPFAFAEGEGNSKVTVVDASGNAVTDVALPQGEKVTLTANAELTGDVQYQWQILADADSDLWVNISGENANTIEASYAMVCSVLKDNETALRCVATGDESATGSAVKVTVTEPQTKAAPAKASAAKANDAEVATLADEGETGTKYSVTILYQFKDGKQAANPWTSSLAAGSDLVTTVPSPAITGYTPNTEEYVINISGISRDVTYTVTYYPAEVEYTVNHYQQNVDDDKYTLFESETIKGYTESEVKKDLAKEYTGFTSLIYDDTTKIAADSSTSVDVYYDRNYYLMKFDLGGGYGVEPIYARYGSKIGDIGTPTRAGYTFEGWELGGAEATIPTTMPSDNRTYTAKWSADKANLTVVFWYENSDDNNYSYAGMYTDKDLTPRSEKSSVNYRNQDFTGRDTSHFTYNADKAETVTIAGDGSSVLNVYFTRNTYTLIFRELTCTSTNLFHSHNDSCYTQCATITAKYNAKISDEFSKAPFNTTYNGRAWKCTEPSKYGYALQTLDRMPGFDATFKLYAKNSDTKKTIYYYVQKVGTTVNSNQWPTSNTNFDLLKQVDTYFKFATYEEEYHEIQGFTRYAKNISFNETYGYGWDSQNNVKNFKNNKLELYYMRNSYNLSFYNYNADVAGKGGSVQYEAPLTDYDFVPDYPSNLEANAYVFDGWYTSPGCYAGSEADMSTMTMPASDLKLYAKWSPKTHTVRTFLDKEASLAGSNPLSSDTVNHGSPAPKQADPTNGEYVFVGWFYSDNGVEKAFDFSMSVTKDLDLYAKWSSNKVVPYVLKYAIKNDDGSLTYIAEDTIGSALAGTTKTFEAKTGSDLKDGYQTGYFPETSSHSLVIDIDSTKNEYTFIYVAKEKVPYTVRYLEKDTGKVLASEKHAETANAIETGNYEPIQGYRPDAFQKRLVLSANEKDNVITFWYVEDTVHAPVMITHWIQNIDGNGYTEYQSSTNVNGVIGETYTESPLSITGFKYNASASTNSGKLEDYKGLTLDLYYDREVYPYSFKFLEENTDKVLADEISGNARYQSRVNENAKDIPGYTLVSADTLKIDISTDESKNVGVFYYRENQVTINYVALTGGTVDNPSETIKAKTGNAVGSTATANQGYKFVGWYTDESCSTPVDSTWVDSNHKIIPGKINGINVSKTYYAKFKRDVVDLKIQKTGWQDIDENQSFVFHVSGNVEGNSDLAKAVEMDVVIHGNGVSTVKGLPFGSYIVTEKSGWSWRYTPVADDNSTLLSQTAIFGDDGELTKTLNFNNSRPNTKWLNGSSYEDNNWSLDTAN